MLKNVAIRGWGSPNYAVRLLQGRDAPANCNGLSRLRIKKSPDEVTVHGRRLGTSPPLVIWNRVMEYRRALKTVGTRGVLPLIIAITMVSTFGMHVLVAVLAGLMSGLGAGRLAVQLTITVYLVGLAVGQLVYGPLSDRCGRRPLLISCLLLYSVGCALAVFGSSIYALLVLRFIQALGASGPLVIGRAMIRDISFGGTVTARLSLLTIAMSLTPGIAPIVGAQIYEHLGWRAIFGLLAAVTFLLAMLACVMLPETQPQQYRTFPKRFGEEYRTLIGIPKFWRFAIAGAASTSSIYGFLCAAPFLFIEVFGESPSKASLYCFMATTGIAVGSIVSYYPLRAQAPRFAINLGAFVCLSGALALLLVNTVGGLSVLGLIAPVAIYSIGVGILAPHALAGVLNAGCKIGGSASSLYGSIQMAAGVSFTVVAGAWHSSSVVPIAAMLIVAALVTLTAMYWPRLECSDTRTRREEHDSERRTRSAAGTR